MKILRIIHTGYGLFVFSVLFLVLLPFLFIPIVFPGMHRLVGVINRVWAKMLFIFCLLPYRIVVRGKLDPHQSYVFCPNHFSYLDIPTMGLNPHNAIFVGKNEMERIPLFGFMYRKLHITVDRSSLKSRGNSMRRSLEAIDEGKSLVIYPEGGIISTDPPRLSTFKDGAFRTAVEKQIPIVPVTIPHNWILLPDGQFLIRWGVIEVIFHEPISTKGCTTESISMLKEQVRQVIETELGRQNSTAVILA